VTFSAHAQVSCCLYLGLALRTLKLPTESRSKYISTVSKGTYRTF